MERVYLGPVRRGLEQRAEVGVDADQPRRHRLDEAEARGFRPDRRVGEHVRPRERLPHRGVGLRSVISDLRMLAEEAFHQSLNPNETKVREMAKRRIGQDIFRRLLLEYWNRRCPISGIDDPRLLRASHIKHWAACDNRERLDPFNGILLSANLDAAFDAGIISFRTMATFCARIQSMTPILSLSALVPERDYR